VPATKVNGTQVKPTLRYDPNEPPFDPSAHLGAEDDNAA
jgi:hypothetical protein